MLILRTPRLTCSRTGFLARSTALSWPWNKDRLLAAPGTLPPTFADLALGLADCRKPVIQMWCKDPVQREETRMDDHPVVPASPVVPAQAGTQGLPPDDEAAALGPRLREDDGTGAGHHAASSTQDPMQREDDARTSPNAPAFPVVPAQAGTQGLPPDDEAAALGPRLREDDRNGTGHHAATTPKNPIQRERTGPLRNGNPRGNPDLAPRCGARTRRTGCPCRAPAMRNGKCRLHGGKSTGPRTEEGRARIRAARTRHGRYTAEARTFQRDITFLLHRNRELLKLASQPGPIDAEALRHLLPPQFGKHLMHRETAAASRAPDLPLTRKNPVHREEPPISSPPPPTSRFTPTAAPPAAAVRRPILLMRPTVHAT